MATKREAERAAEQHADDLSGFPNVVGIGVQPFRAASNQRQHVVTVYVARKFPVDELREDERLPPFVQIAGSRGSVRVPVKVVESGSFEIEDTE